MDDETQATPLPSLTLGGSVWAIRREVLPRLAEAARSAGMPAWANLARRTALSAPKAARRSAGQRAGGTVAVLPLTGVLTPRGSLLSMLFGGGFGGLQGFRESFREAVVSPDVGAIVLEIDSPGGLIDLVPETAAEIRDARGTKPIVAVANTLAASGAYWIAAQADELIVTPSGDAGSIGVYMVHEDWSGFNTQMGIEPTYISAGKFKTEGNPDEPLSDQAMVAWQQEVDDLYDLFVNDVAAGRGVSADKVRADYGQGRTLLADRAMQAGMVDRIDTLEAVIGGLLVPGATAGAAARAGRLATIARAAAEDQPRCECGRFVIDGETQCEECKQAAANPTAEDDDPPVDPPPDSDDAPDSAATADAQERMAIAALLI